MSIEALANPNEGATFMQLDLSRVKFLDWYEEQSFYKNVYILAVLVILSRLG
jgi:hypothetical protein